MKSVLLINGVRGDLPWEDAADACEMLVAMERAIPGCDWIDSMVADELNDRHEDDF